MAAVAEAAVAEAKIGKRKEAAGFNRSKSTLARDRWKLVNKHVKQKGSTFFGIDTEVRMDVGDVVVLVSVRPR